jgi:hypothetical protein
LSLGLVGCVEHRFRVMKDFLGLRPVFHWTETRARGHIAICVLAAVIEAVIANLLDTASIHDPDLEGQDITPRRALAELNRIRIHHLHPGERDVTVTTRRNPLQAAILPHSTSTPTPGTRPPSPEPTEPG